MNKQQLISALEDTGALEDIINFYNDNNGAVQTMNNIGDVVHFILEQLSIVDEAYEDQDEDYDLENISLDSQRIM